MASIMRSKFIPWLVGSAIGLLLGIIVYSTIPEVKILPAIRGSFTGLLIRALVLPAVELFCGISAFLLASRTTSGRWGPRPVAFFLISFALSLGSYAILFIAGCLTIGGYFQEAGLGFLPVFLLAWPVIAMYSLPVVLGIIAISRRTP